MAEESKSAASAVAIDPNIKDDKSEHVTTVKLHPAGAAGTVNTPQDWQKILEKDRARAQWIAGRVQEASKAAEEGHVSEEGHNTRELINGDSGGKTA